VEQNRLFKSEPGNAFAHQTSFFDEQFILTDEAAYFFDDGLLVCLKHCYLTAEKESGISLCNKSVANTWSVLGDKAISIDEI